VLFYFRSGEIFSVTIFVDDMVTFVDGIIERVIQILQEPIQQRPATTKCKTEPKEDYSKSIRSYSHGGLEIECRTQPESKDIGKENLATALSANMRDNMSLATTHPGGSIIRIARRYVLVNSDYFNFINKI
jgi:hypothetical protein